MPSLARRRRQPVAAALLACAAVAFAAPPTTPPHDLRREVAAAVIELRQDPNLGAERTVRTLRWVDREHKPATPSPLLARLLEWLANAFRWFATAGRAVLVTAAALLAALLAVYLVRAIARRRTAPALPEAGRPAFVRGLDIRPESLPEDIGAAALVLWRQGAARAALALLYRGLLSRAVHAHHVPIRDSSTEGDCLRLCAARLPAAAQDYAAALVGTWQLAVYRGVLPGETRVVALCEGFAAASAPPAAAPAAVGLAEGARA